MLKNFTVILCLALAGCQSNSTESLEQIASPHPATQSIGQEFGYSPLQPIDGGSLILTEPIHVTMQGMDIVLTPPREWQVYTSEDSIVLAERMGSIDSGGELEGVQVHLFVPTLDGLDVPISDDTNVAYYILEQMSKKSRHSAKGTMTEPEAFIWKSCYAAYFLVNGDNSIYTLMLAVIPTGTDQLLAISISAPASRAADIRPTLMQLVQSLGVNGTYLDSTSLRILPNPLVFPSEDATLRTGYIEEP